MLFPCHFVLTVMTEPETQRGKVKDTNSTVTGGEASAASASPDSPVNVCPPGSKQMSLWLWMNTAREDP